jgi:hypothetical protein
VKNEWTFARAWLFRVLGSRNPDSEGAPSRNPDSEGGP